MIDRRLWYGPRNSEPCSDVQSCMKYMKCMNCQTSTSSAIYLPSTVTIYLQSIQLDKTVQKNSNLLYPKGTSKYHLH